MHEDYFSCLFIFGTEDIKAGLIVTTDSFATFKTQRQGAHYLLA